MNRYILKGEMVLRLKAQTGKKNKKNQEDKKWSELYNDYPDIT